jgi:thioredoxin
MIDATMDNFHSMIRRGKVLVDFYNQKCAPCRALEPVLVKFEEEQVGKVVVVRVNVDELPSIARRYCIQSLPSILLFENGVVSRQLTDHPSLATLKRFVA